MEHLTVKEIKEWVESRDRLLPEEIAALEKDQRVSVQRLAALCKRLQREEMRALFQRRRLYRFRRILYSHGFKRIAGVDEVGRGPLAGPVVAAAVVLPTGLPSFGVDDSKKLSQSQREELYKRIKQEAIAVGIGIAQPQEIDELNIHNASLMAMYRALSALQQAPDFCLVDGRFLVPGLEYPQRAIVKGDCRCDVIAAASVIAKVTRDRLLEELDAVYPFYGFAANKGYPTSQHIQALREHGPSPVHRYSYAPVRLAGENAAVTRGEKNSDCTG
ncbi:MAG TPA: ribonuclease HII [Firmicutes bacterium]|nr:ribonuclease HII [Bacillota bacterium]